MTPREVLKFKKMLERERDAAVRAALQRRESIVVEQTAEALEQTVYDGERELALADLTRHSERIREIRAALGRIETGTFGVCRHCRRPIGAKRMAAVPWTSLCIRCQESADRTGLDSADETRATAA